MSLDPAKLKPMCQTAHVTVVLTVACVLQTTQQLKAKAWADIVESLIGCIYLEAGENAAMEFLVYLGIIPEVPIGFEREPTVQIAEVNMDDNQLATDIVAAESAAAALDLGTSAEPAQDGATAAAPAGAAEAAMADAADLFATSQDTGTAGNGHGTDMIRTDSTPGSMTAGAQAPASKVSDASSDQSNSVPAVPHVNGTAAADPAVIRLSRYGCESSSDSQIHGSKATQESFQTARTNGGGTSTADQAMYTADGMSDSAVVQSHANGHASPQTGAEPGSDTGLKSGDGKLTADVASATPGPISNPSSKHTLHQAEHSPATVQVKLEPQDTVTDSVVMPVSSDPNVIVISDDDDDEGGHDSMQSGYMLQSGYGANSDSGESDSAESDSAEQGDNPEEIEIAEEEVEGDIPLPPSPTHPTQPIEMDPSPVGVPVTVVPAITGDGIVPGQPCLGTDLPLGEEEDQVKKDAMAFLAMEEDSGDEQPARPPRGQVMYFPVPCCLPLMRAMLTAMHESVL